MHSESLTQGWVRDINHQRLGYFRTDDSTTRELIRITTPQALETDSDRIHLFDPCCGEGLAISEIASAWGATTTWGIEYDNDRYLASTERVDTVLHGDALASTHVSKFWAGACLFNPPYADDVDAKGRKTRLESLFWTAHSGRLMRGGLMIAILPRQALSRSPGLVLAMSKYFSGERMEIFRTHDQKYNQVVIIGYRSRDKFLEPSDEVRQTLVDVGRGNIELPELSQAETGSFEVPAGKTPAEFDCRVLTEQTAKVALETMSGRVLEAIDRDLMAHRVRRIRHPALTQIRQGHIPPLLAAGGLNGFVKDSKQSLLVKGSVRRVAVKSTETTEKEGETSSSEQTNEVTVYKPQTQVHAIDFTPGANFQMLKIQ